MHTDTTSLWPDWQRQSLSIVVDRALTELRRGRPVLMQSQPGKRPLMPGYHGCTPSGADNGWHPDLAESWLFVPVETLTPDMLRLIEEVSRCKCLLLSAQRVAALLALREKSSDVQPGAGKTAVSAAERVAQGQLCAFELPGPREYQSVAGREALASILGLSLRSDAPGQTGMQVSGEVPAEDYLHVLREAAGLAPATWFEVPPFVRRALDAGMRPPAENGSATAVAAILCDRSLVASPPVMMSEAAIAVAREARLAPALVAVRIQTAGKAVDALYAVRSQTYRDQQQAEKPADQQAILGAWLQSLLPVDPAQVLQYVSDRPAHLEEISDAPVPLERIVDGPSGAHAPGTVPIGSRFVVFREKNTDFEHVAVIVGDPDFNGPDPVRVRLHSSCLTGDLFGSLRCDCGDQLRGTVQRLAREGGGIILYLSQEGRGIGIANKLRAYRLQDAGQDTLDANQSLGFRMDERHFEVAAAMLKSLGCTRIQLLTNNPAKIESLRAAGIDVVEREPVKGEVNPHNQQYLVTKMKRAGHLFERSELRLPDRPAAASLPADAARLGDAARPDDAARSGEAARSEGLVHPRDAALQAGGVAVPASASSDAGFTPSRAIRARILQAGQRFHANDNIAAFIRDDELALLQDEVAERMQALLESLVIDTESDHNTQDTARRVAKMYLNEVFAGRYRAAPDMTEFPNVEKLNELLVVGPITVRSACSHHFCPIMGRLWVGVLPNADSNLIGLSKYARLADWIMSRPQIQEEAVKTLADELERRLAPDGLAVIMKADHFCMHWRGVKDESQMTSSVMRGAFLRNSSLRRELLSLIADMGKG